MAKRIFLVIFALFISLLFIIPVHSDSGLKINGSSVISGFPSSLKFTISAQSNSLIMDIRLHYTTSKLGFANITSESYLIFTPATNVSADWTWDMRRSGGIPPGTTVFYWWTITDNNGNTITTDKSKFNFDDTRFTWQKIIQDKTTIYWYSGTQIFAADLMSTTQEALTRLGRDTGAYLSEPIRIYIYANSNDLRGSMLFPQEWTGGVTFSEFGCIAIGISTANLAWGKTAIAHELTHLVTHQITLNPYNVLPTWLEEGLAMYNQGSVDATFTYALQVAVANKTLLTLKTLSSPFSSYTDVSYLSYAESWSAVAYLIKTYGKEKMSQLLNTFHRGSTHDNALLVVYGKDTKTLNTEWQATLKASATVKNSRVLV